MLRELKKICLLQLYKVCLEVSLLSDAQILQIRYVTADLQTGIKGSTK
jgi:hypothetical protein